MEKILAPFRQSKQLNVVFLSNVFLAFHYYLVVYINSSYLSGFFSDTQISTLYIVGSFLNTLVLLNISKILNQVGNFKTILYMISFELMAILGLAVSVNHFLIGLYFIIHLVCVPVILFNLDIFLESVSPDESKTGSIRGMYLTLSNLSLVIAPSIVALLLVKTIYWHVYLLSFLFLIPLFFLILTHFKDFKKTTLQHIHIRETIVEYVRNKNLYNVFCCHFLLQFFYAFMIVYTPLYLQEHIGFTWSQTGIMFTIMLLPFVLFELPVGEATDGRFGEKEFLTIGFIIMGLATMFISFVTLKSFWIWTSMLFITRIGASLVEISADSYFFRHVNQTQTDLISFYRMGTSLAFMAAPLVATLALQFLPFQYIFIVIGACMIVGTRYALALGNTRHTELSN